MLLKSKNEIKSYIAKIINTDSSQILIIDSLKSGMTNNSYLFSYHQQKYIIRLSGEGSNYLIDRQHEYDVYQALKVSNIADEIIYIDPKTGCKITRFIENSHTCNPHNWQEVKLCITCLKNFHNLKLKVKHYFDIFQNINFYQSLLKDQKSKYLDYAKTKSNIFSLKSFVDYCPKELILTHIDAVPDNFLLYSTDKNNQSNISSKLIDWEYASLQDPHLDIAAFAVYSLYNKQEIDKLISLYFDYNVKPQTRAKIYCYIAMLGLLWSNWCEYKENFGTHFGKYSIAQYNYAKEFYMHATSLIKTLSDIKYINSSNIAQRAIIMAAGKGTRMHPVTINTPKPLVKINQIPIIENIIKALHQNKINEIYVVVGYKKEQFYYLEQKYPGLKIIENPYYNTCNNISSLYVAREHVNNCIILDGDQIIHNIHILSPHFSNSCYCCAWNENLTKEWMLSLKNHIVQSCSRTGGEKNWQLYSVSFWNQKDGKKLVKHCEQEFINLQHTQLYWDDIALFCYPQQYNLSIRSISNQDITEIDSIDELAAIDNSYECYLKGKK